jgi:hypothetical protein
MRIWLLRAAALAVALELASGAAIAAPVASITQTGPNPRLLVRDLDDDGTYDSASTLDPTVGAAIELFCDDKVASPGGLVALLDGGPDWTTSYFTFVYDENAIGPLAIGLPNPGTTELPPAVREEAIELCNGVPAKQVRRKDKILTDQFMGFLGVVGACVAGPSVGLDTPVLDFLQDLFEDGIVDFDSSGFGPPLQTGLTPFGADVVCESHAVDDLTQRTDPVNVPLPDPWLKKPLEVTQAFLTAVPQNADGKCGVTLSGVVVTDGPGTVKFVYENHLGIPSGSFTVAINQTLTAFFAHYIDFSTGDGLWLVTPEDQPDAGDTFTTEQLFDYQGFFRMAGTSPAGWESNNAEYAFDCDEEAVLDLELVIETPEPVPTPPAPKLELG